MRESVLRNRILTFTLSILISLSICPQTYGESIDIGLGRSKDDLIGESERIFIREGFSDCVGLSNLGYSLYHYFAQGESEDKYLDGIPIVRNYNDQEEIYCPQEQLAITPSLGRKNSPVSVTYRQQKKLPSKINFNNIVIFIRFKDEDDFVDTKVIGMYREHYNGKKFSLKQYMTDISYGQYDVETSFFPQDCEGKVYSYLSNERRGYFSPYKTSNPSGYPPIPPESLRRCANYAEIKQSRIKEKTRREHQLFYDAISYCKEMIESKFPNADNLDSKNKGTVDNIVFVVSGREDGYDDIFWPHQWSLSTKDICIHNKRVDGYNLMLHGCFEENNLGTTVHEFLHVNGFPDLYRSPKRGEPVSRWDIMSLQYPIPQFPTTYSRYGYGGFCDTPQLILEGGKYTLFPSNIKNYQLDIAYKLASSLAKNDIHDEFFMVEYRNPTLSQDSSDLTRYPVSYTHLRRRRWRPR